MASDWPELVGRAAALRRRPGFMARLRADGRGRHPPIAVGGAASRCPRGGRVGAPTQFVCAWVRSAWQGRTARCASASTRSRTFNVVLERGQPGATGEAYAIDRDGRLLYAEPLRGGAGRDGPAGGGGLVDLQRAVRVPEERGRTGRVRLRSVRAPLTRLAQAVTSTQRRPSSTWTGTSTTGGSPVVGAAQWLPALDVGLVVKRDADEAWAYVPLRPGRDPRAGRGRRCSSSPPPPSSSPAPAAKLEELSGSLERMVQERTAALAVSEERGRLILGAVTDGIFGSTPRAASPS